MRINIQVPSRAEGDECGSAFASSSRLDLSKIPLPLVELAESSRVDASDPDAGAGELVLIELQGTLEIDDADPEGGQILGKLEFHKGREDKPTLLVSHHRLEGKIVSLPKPFVVLERKQRAASLEERQALGMIDTNADRSMRNAGKSSPYKAFDVPSSPLRFQRRSATPEAREDEGLGNAPDSPSMGRKRAAQDSRDADLLRSSPAPVRTRQDVLSSSPMPPPRAMRGSEVDYSSPLPASKRQRMGATRGEGEDLSALPALTEQDEDARPDKTSNDDDEEWLYKRETATYFDVVCVIRRKILFSKRPEPVVRLDDESEAANEARAAIGKSLVVCESVYSS